MRWQCTMRLMFIHHVIEDRGSAQDIFHYAQVAKGLGHEVVLFGGPGKQSPFNYTTDLSSIDAAIFIFEFTTQLQYGDLLAWARLLHEFRARVGWWWTAMASTMSRSRWLAI